jgi:hypothetical protein
MTAFAESDVQPSAGAGQASEPFVFSDRDAVELLLSGTQEEFPRPATRLNRVIATLAKRLPERELTSDDLRRWLQSSLEVFAQFVADRDALNRIGLQTAWIVSDSEPPDPDVWSGECKFAGGGLPIVICYSRTLASRLPGETFDLAWQGSMDHFVGHLYPFFCGAADASEYAEDIACRYQHLAAQVRGRSDRRFRGIARLMPLTYRLHKQIPISSYETLAS